MPGFYFSDLFIFVSLKEKKTFKNNVQYLHTTSRTKTNSRLIKILHLREKRNKSGNPLSDMSDMCICMSVSLVFVIRKVFKLERFYKHLIPKYNANTDRYITVY